MTFTLGISPCPNDTFIFEPLINKRINTSGIMFSVFFDDIENLNQSCIRHVPDICKISTAAYPSIADHYQILTAGSAIGYKNGPVLVSRKKIYPDELSSVNIAIPGFTTTANLLLTNLYPDAKNKKAYLFSMIEEVILSGEQDAGLLIHESRFTYEKKGLKKIIDAGEEWEKRHHLPLALGNIIIRRSLPPTIKQQVNQWIRDSINYSISHPGLAQPFITAHSTEKDDQIIKQHISLYVNDFTLHTGEKGKEAIQQLLSGNTINWADSYID